MGLFIPLRPQMFTEQLGMQDTGPEQENSKELNRNGSWQQPTYTQWRGQVLNKISQRLMYQCKLMDNEGRVEKWQQKQVILFGGLQEGFSEKLTLKMRLLWWTESQSKEKGPAFLVGSVFSHICEEGRAVWYAWSLLSKGMRMAHERGTKSNAWGIGYHDGCIKDVWLHPK